MSCSEIRGRVFWHELHTSDVPAAKAFYGAVVGWRVQGEDLGGFLYEMWANARGAVGGVVNPAEMPGGQAVSPHWLAYFGTPDVDETTGCARALGATVLSPPTDIPGIGRFAVLEDPQGAVFAVYTPAQPNPEQPPHTPGAFSWSELFAADVETAWSFYAALFGWVRTAEVDLGHMGAYRMFGRHPWRSDGGFLRKTPEIPGPPRWLYYVTVPDLAAALRCVGERGGHVAWGPQQLSGQERIATCVDPQGAVFALYERSGERA